RYHLGTILGDAARLVLAADHEAGNVLQEQERDAALATQLDEMGALEGRLGEQNAVVGDDADRNSAEMCEPGHQRRAVERLELVEHGAIDQPADDGADVEPLPCI